MVDVWNKTIWASVVCHVSFLTPVSQPHTERTQTRGSCKVTFNPLVFTVWLQFRLLGSDIHLDRQLALGLIRKNRNREMLGVWTVETSVTRVTVKKRGHEVEWNWWEPRSRQAFYTSVNFMLPSKSFLDNSGNNRTPFQKKEKVKSPSTIHK